MSYVTEEVDGKTGTRFAPPARPTEEEVRLRMDEIRVDRGLSGRLLQRVFDESYFITALCSDHVNRVDLLADLVVDYAHSPTKKYLRLQAADDEVLWDKLVPAVIRRTPANREAPTWDASSKVLTWYGSGTRAFALGDDTMAHRGLQFHASFCLDPQKYWETDTYWHTDPDLPWSLGKTLQYTMMATRLNVPNGPWAEIFAVAPSGALPALCRTLAETDIWTHAVRLIES